jgi:hypothetical protein
VAAGTSGNVPEGYYPGYAGPAAARRSLPPGGAWRIGASVVLLLLGCLLAPFALAGLWVHNSFLSTDGFVATVDPLADDPAVQQAVADAITTKLYDALNLGQNLQSTLPGQLGSLAQPVAEQLKNLTRDLTRRIVSSDAFHVVWRAAAGRAHTTIVALIEDTGPLELTQDGLVLLDFSDVSAQVTQLLQASGISLPQVLPSSVSTGAVALVHSRALVQARTAIVAVDRFAFPLAALVLVLLAGSVLISTGRLGTVMGVGLGLVLMMGLFEAGLALARAYYLSTADDAKIPHGASVAVWNIVTRDLRAAGWIVLAVGGCLVAVAGVAAVVLSLRARRLRALPQRR